MFRNGFLINLYSFFSVAKVFNYSRPITINRFMTKNRRPTINSNESYPWKTEDKLHGLFIKIDFLPSGIKQFASHPNVEYRGINYVFHDPFELPSDKNQQFFSHINSKLIFYTEAEINELGETLMNYGLEKFAK